MSATLKKHNRGFSSAPNGLINSKEISLTAKGLFVFMDGKPQGWNFTIRSMAKQLKEGVTAISNALGELKHHGWVSYQKNQDGSGVYSLHWEPSPDDENQYQETPNTENPDQGFPKLGKPVCISKKDSLERNINSNPPLTPKGEPSPDDEKPKTSKAGAERIMGLYNILADGVLSKAMSLTPKRQRQIDQVCRLTMASGKQPFADYNEQAWGSYFQLLLANPWNRGENQRGWKADFDYAIRTDVVLKTLEREYA